MEANTPFPCDACGKCCRHVNLSEQTSYLDRGYGICHYFNESTNLCSIYETRPLVCRVEDYYKIYLTHIYDCLLYTSPSPRDVEESRMPSSA